MAGNKSLNAAAVAKKDEFYTQLQDIANELRHYKRHFEGKTVLCNCDDPYESNFFKYFALNFNALRLKRLICTCYNGSPVAGKELQLVLFGDAVSNRMSEVGNFASQRTAYKVELTEVTDVNGDGAADLLDVQELLRRNPPTVLRENGDFRSRECIELLKQADIVVTNPPFSLFREYVAQLVEYKKKFLIIGNMNAITYKEIFPLLKKGIVWVGYGFNMTYVYKTTYTNTLESNQKYVRSKGYDPDEGYVKNPAQCWFTNLEHNKRHLPIELYKSYSPEEYPRYDNYDAIEVSKVADIPMNYDGIMGVPISFMGKYCLEQFDLIGVANHGQDNEYDLFAPTISRKLIFKRILIRHKK